MNKEICNWCKEAMGNSLHCMYGNYIHIRCETIIRNISKNDYEKWINSQSTDKTLKGLKEFREKNWDNKLSRDKAYEKYTGNSNKMVKG